MTAMPSNPDQLSLQEKIHEAVWPYSGERIDGELVHDLLQLFEATCNEARIDEQKRSSPHLVDNGKSMTASIIVAVDANTVVSQTERLAELIKGVNHD